MANDIDWNSDLTHEEQAALDSDECGQMELSRFYQKLIANVIIQQKNLNALKVLCAKHEGFACGGVTEVTPNEKTNDGTPLHFKYDGKEKTIAIPRGEDCTSCAPEITGMTKAEESGNNKYVISYGGSSSATFTATKGDKGTTGAADDGTEYYGNGAVKRKNSVTGVSMSGPGLVSASITGLNVSANGVLLSLFGLSISGDAFFNASSIANIPVCGETTKAGAYKSNAGG